MERFKILIDDKLVTIKINGRNKEKYKNILDLDIKNGDIIEIYQYQVLPFSRDEVECICDLCQTHFKRNRINVRNITLCGKECRNKYFITQNPNPKKDKLKVKCETCDEDMYVNKSVFKKRKHHLCSRDCYKIHRSRFYNKENTYNYQNFQVECDYCGELHKTIQWEIENREHKFCSQECYFSFRRENYREFYFSKNINNGRPESVPERKVREYLDVNKINNIQEYTIDNIYFADFYLPEYNSIIEVYGDYWHSNSKIYGKGKRQLNEIQIKNMKRDNRRNAHIKHLGYNLYIIWESDIKENINYHMEMLIDTIINEQKSLTTIRQTL